MHVPLPVCPAVNKFPRYVLLPMCASSTLGCQAALDVTTERLLILVLRNFAFDGLIDWDTFAYEPISERGCNDPTGCLVEALRAVAGDEAADAWFGSVNVKLE